MSAVAQTQLATQKTIQSAMDAVRAATGVGDASGSANKRLSSATTPLVPTISGPGAPPVSQSQSSNNPTSGQSLTAADPSNPNPSASLMQLRQDIPPAPPLRNSRKRKSPPSGAASQGTNPPGPPQPNINGNGVAGPGQAPGGLHPSTFSNSSSAQQSQASQSQQQGALPPHLQHYYAPPPPGADYTTAGLQNAQQHLQAIQNVLAAQQVAQAQAQQAQVQQQGQGQQPQSPDDGDDGNGMRSPGNNRQLSTSKRAEQNRKAQRAFRERRDQHVKQLESRSQLLDAALASADEANRRWEECRNLVDQLRVENAQLRANLQQAQSTMAQHGISLGVDGGGGGGGAGQRSVVQSRQPSVAPGEDVK